MKRIETGMAARLELLRSLQPLSRAIGASLGTEGRACIYQHGAEIRRASTGAEIAARITGSEGAATLAQRILVQTLLDADRELGDGTARLAILAIGVFSEAVRLIGAGADPGSLSNAILALRHPLRVALANQILPEPRMRRMLQCAGAPESVVEPLLTLWQERGSETAIEVVARGAAGVEVDSGLGYLLECRAASESFEPAIAARIEFSPAHVLVVDDIVEDLGMLIPVLDGFATRGKSLVIAARDIRGAALQMLTSNRRANGLRVLAIKPVAVSQQAADILEDLAIATGATLVCERMGTSLSALRPAMLGRTDSVSYGAGRAIFRHPAGDEGKVSERRRLVLAEADRHRHLALDRARLQTRAARLTGRWATLGIGQRTERETSDALGRARRAVASMRAGLEGGTIIAAHIGLQRALVAVQPANGANVLQSPEAAAVCCAESGVLALARCLPANPDPLRTFGGNGGSDVPSEAPLDPLPLVQEIVERALSTAATLARADAFISS